MDLVSKDEEHGSISFSFFLKKRENLNNNGDNGNDEHVLMCRIMPFSIAAYLLL